MRPYKFVLACNLQGYTRGAVIDKNEFVSIGESAISQWGYTDGSPVPGMGWDARAGRQPRGTVVTYNLVHEGEPAWI